MYDQSAIKVHIENILLRSQISVVLVLGFENVLILSYVDFHCRNNRSDIPLVRFSVNASLSLPIIRCVSWLQAVIVIFELSL